MNSHVFLFYLCLFLYTNTFFLDMQSNVMKPDFCMKLFKLSFTYAQLANETQWGCIICSRHWDVCRLLNTLWYCSVCIAICESTPPLNILSACLNSSHVSKDLKELLYTSHTYNFSTSACHVFDETLRKWMDLNNVCK